MLNIQELIQDHTKLNEETLPILREMVDKYPFYQTARLLLVANLFELHHKDFGKELRKASVLVADRLALFSIVESAHYQIEKSSTPAATIETESDVNRTISLIDTFLSQTKNDVNNPQPSIADITNDYAAFLQRLDDIKEEEEDTENEQADQTPRLKGGDLIDNFIESTRDKRRIEMPDLPDDYYHSPEISTEDEEIYTENMVNIYIRQARYEQALEILRKICLNNPKKSANFAAQIKLLEVIISEKK